MNRDCCQVNDDRLNRRKSLPSALDRSVVDRLARTRLAIFLDYDGTLTPIVRDPNGAVLSSETHKVIAKLGSIFPVTILSGRDVGFLKRMVGLKNVIYAGSHGFDVSFWDEKKIGKTRNWKEFLPNLNLAEEFLRQELSGLAGVLVERKRFSIAVHYRRVTKSNQAVLKKRFNKIALQFPALKICFGKMILELLPNVDWNKGTTLLSLVEILDPKALPVFIGDDLTDEDAFRVIKDKGAGILVGKSKRYTSARYSLRNHSEVRVFLEQLIRIRRSSISLHQESRNDLNQFRALCS